MAACYRHPDRETNVACSSCGRPICTDCMTSTPVGMRCLECGGQRTQVRAVTPGMVRTAAPATFVLLVLNVVAFLAEVGGGGGAASFNGGGTVINNFGLYGPAVADGEWYRIVTAGFLHAGPLHLGLNMFALYILGNLLEKGVGTARFVGAYFASLLAGSFGALLLDPNTVTVGASGAIFGLMSAAFMIARHRGLEQLASRIGFYVIINIAFTLGVPGISIGAHFGGLASGALAGLAITVGERHRQPAAEALALVAIGVVSAIGALLAAQASVP